MSYTPQFTPQYPDGWKNKPYETSAIIAQALNSYDSTFEYIEDYLADAGSISWDELNILAAKNFLDNTANSAETAGLTFTVNVDKSVKVNGTATDTVEFYVMGTSTSLAPLGAITNGCLLTGTPSGGSSGTYYMYASSLSTNYGADYGEGVALSNVSNAGIRVCIRVVEGTTLNNVLFKPMIRLASIGDDTYVPFALTNKQLTDRMDDFVGSFCNLNDVNITNPQNGQVPKYNSENDKWENGDELTIIANPQDTPTDDLETIQIGDTVYDIPGGGSGNTNMWTGTQAEYEAQASTIEDGTLVNITDDFQIVESCGELYSTVERCVGIWTDGKPLYEITFNIPSLPSTAYSTVNYPHGIANIDTVVKYTGIGRWASGSITILPATQINNLGANAAASFYAYVDKTNVSIMTGMDRSAMSADFIIQYTKTTDSAVPVISNVAPYYHVFSTDEHVVGQWVDGSILYEKTVNFGALPNNASKSVNHNITNLDYTVSIEATAKNSTTKDVLPLPFAHRTNINYSIQMSVSETQVIIITAANQSSYDECFVTLQYTKTS